MLQDTALLGVRQSVAWGWGGGCEDTQTPSLVSQLCTQTPPGAHTSPVPFPRWHAEPIMTPGFCSCACLWQTWRCFAEGRKDHWFHLVFPQPSLAPKQALLESYTLKSDANLPTTEITNWYKLLFLPRHKCNLRNALLCEKCLFNLCAI